MAAIKKSSKPTDMQLKVLIYMAKAMVETGVQPSIREIGAEFGFSSPNGVVCHLKALQKKGLIVRVAMRSRSVLIPNYKKWARRKHV
jgi:repressor LexA